MDYLLKLGAKQWGKKDNKSFLKTQMRLYLQKAVSHKLLTPVSPQST